MKVERRKNSQNMQICFKRKKNETNPKIKATKKVKESKKIRKNFPGRRKKSPEKEDFENGKK